MSPQSQDPHDVETNFASSSSSSSSSSKDNIMACSPPPPPTGNRNDNEATTTAINNSDNDNDGTTLMKETISISSSKGSDDDDDGPTRQQQPQQPRTTEQKKTTTTTTARDDTETNDGQPPSRPPQTTERNKTTTPSADFAAAGTATGFISPLTIIKNKNELTKGSGSGSGILRKLKHKPPHDHPIIERNSVVVPDTTPQVDSYAISKIGQARERIKRSFDKSALLIEDEYVFPRFEMGELTLGRILGKGGFGTVLEITGTDVVVVVEGGRSRDDGEDDDPEATTEERRDGGEGGSPSSGGSAFAEKSTVFFVDELENDKGGNDGNNHHHRRWKGHGNWSHGFRFRRRGHHHRDHGTAGGSERPPLKLCNSHDGLATHDGSRSVSDRGPVPSSLSYDVLSPPSRADGPTDDGSGEERGPSSGFVPSSERRRRPGGGNNIGGNNRSRSKSLTWTHAKAAAHDVSHFFHRSPKNHHRHGHPPGATPCHREIEVALSSSSSSEEKKDACGDDERKGARPSAAAVDAEEEKGVDVANHRDVLDDGRGPPSRQRRQASYDDAGGDRHLPASGRTRQASRNFSFVSWRDSEAGEEGNDAISVEEMKKYNIDSSLSRSVSVEVFLSERGTTRKDGGEDDDEDDGGISSSSGERSDSKDPSTVASASDGSDKKSTVPTNSGGGRCNRRVILKSTPCEVGPLHPEPEEEAVVAVPDKKPSAYYGGHQAELVTTTLGNAAHYGGNQAKELVATTLHTAAYYGGVQQQQQQDKSFITENATTKSGQGRYAIKIISPHIVENDFKKFLQAAMDMATETYFLSVLNHPNILKLRAVGQGDMFSPSYFLVFDRLYDTLSDRIEGTWRTQLDHLENSILIWGRAKKLRSLWEERMSAMRNLAGALHHLHALKIIYRDIKPENVGFDGGGTVKLFDFGLAKECHEEDRCANGTYKLTPNTGSIRYMAPENANKWPYDFRADSYSFGIMLWEVASLERPFACYTPREIQDMVMKWGERPKVKEGWSEPVVTLMKECWDAKFRNRPSMEAIKGALEKEIVDSPI
mmetsp:Transcript_31062/g.57560  ORF Transcript_31062/g.57560 Transcript_31062/m.57560 type:complete len:1046 (-) Transcript_31062:13-3150(-)